MRTVILSTNDNPDYFNYLPYVQKAWNKLGWNTLTFYSGQNALTSEIENENNKIIYLHPIDGYRIETIVQVSRLFGFKFCDGLVMTSDVDMMPLSNYWNPNESELTVYGYDLTGFSEFPICYISAPKEIWQQLIPEVSIKEFLDKYKNAVSEDFYKWWGVDQQAITERILKYGNYTQVNRGKDGILAYGRIDRYDWNGTKNKIGEKIDAHLPRPFNQIESEYLLQTYHND